MFFYKNKFLKFSIFIFFIILIGFFSYHLKNFKLDASSDTLILQNDSDFQYYKYYNEIFPNRNFLVLAIESEDEIDSKYINEINKIKSLLLNIQNIESVFTLVDAPILLSNNLNLNELNSEKISNINNTNLSLENILEEFSQSPIYKNQIISENKKISAIIIYPKKQEKFLESKKKRDLLLSKENNKNIFFQNKDRNNIIKIYNSLKDKTKKERKILIQKIRSSLSDASIPYNYYLGGIDMISDDSISFVKNDIFVFSISVSIILILILYLIFREIKWVIISLISTLYSIFLMMGLNGFLGWEITAISANFISLMFILSVSMNIHIINFYRIHYEENNENKIINKTFKNMFFPCLYTILTTIVAFGSLIFSDIKPVIDFGKIMILSLIVIFFSSFTILPLSISLTPKINNNIANLKKILNLFQIFLKYKFTIIIINISLFFMSLFGMYNLNVENSFINYFKKDTEIYKGMKLIDEKLGGTTPIDVIINFKEENLFVETEVEEDFDLEFDLTEDLFEEETGTNIWFTEEKLFLINQIHSKLENMKEVGKVQSIKNLIETAELINKKPLSDFELNVIYNKIPEEYKLSLIAPYISIDKNMAKISARIRDSMEINRNNIINDLKKELLIYTPQVESIKINGLLILYNNMLQSLFSSQIKSFGIVLFLIFGMFLLLFKSMKLSLIGIVPNIFASSFILGLIGVLKIPLDIMTITIAAITIGIAVDNTIHYLYRFKKNYNLGYDLIESIRLSHITVGQAVLTTSITIALGFSVLCLSNFIPTILFGLFTSIAMIVAMLGVLITLPILLQLFYRKL